MALFPPEGVPGLPDHTPILKRFEVGVLLVTIPERIAATAVNNEDGKKTYERTGWAIHTTFAFDLIPQNDKWTLCNASLSAYPVRQNFRWFLTLYLILNQ